MHHQRVFTAICLGICLFAAVQAQNEQGDPTRTTVTEPKKQPVYIKVGGQISLGCEDSEGTDVDWYKDTVIIDTSDTATNGSFYNADEQDEMTGQGTVTKSFLKKDAVTLGDQGSYSCMPANGQDPYHVNVFVFQLTGVDAMTNRTWQAMTTLSCVVENLDSYTMSWYRAGNKLEDVEGKYTIVAGNDSLHIAGATEPDFGEYMCVVELNNDESYNTTVYLKSTAHIHPLAKSKNIIQGDPLQLDCKAYGYPVPTVQWYRGEDPVETIENADVRLSLKDFVNPETGVTVVNATLRITDLDYDDRADYRCVATNGLWGESAEEAILIRVKDKLAALWPFLGICAEVTILCIIIFIYERRRAKKLEEEEAREEADHLTNSHGHKGNDEVRQRK